LHTIRHYHLTIYIIYAETEREKLNNIKMEV